MVGHGTRRRGSGRTRSSMLESQRGEGGGQNCVEQEERFEQEREREEGCVE